MNFLRTIEKQNLKKFTSLQYQPRPVQPSATTSQDYSATCYNRSRFTDNMEQKRTDQTCTKHTGWYQNIPRYVRRLQKLDKTKSDNVITTPICFLIIMRFL
ncbi:hypothetical protein JTB14_027650 [Gonioctena quinquepunctata]|nr:hypothetical protein JTB14_027650 [Gonioctena quinquepunctata]